MGGQVVVITHGRWHSFDLATELQAANRLAAIYTGYPRSKVRNTDVDPRLIHCFPWFVVPNLAAYRIPFMPRVVHRELAWRAGETLGAYAARTLPPCDVVTALSGSGREAGKVVQSRGGVYVCERCSTHIDWGEQVLRDEYAELGLPWHGTDPRSLANERIEYELADAVVVPSQVAARSFVDMGMSPSKIRCVPFGVDLSAYRRSAPRADRFRVLFVGALSVRKGLHYLLQAFRKAALPNAELVLVGSRTGDSETLLRRYPVDNLVETGILPRDGVVREMSRAHVMMLPSIEEGLAMVQPQALACGCPVIASRNTGAEDLFDDGVEGFIVPPRDVDALAERLTRLYLDRPLLDRMAVAAVARMQAVGGWRDYGRRAMAIYDELLAAKRQSTRARSAEPEFGSA